MFKKAIKRFWLNVCLKGYCFFDKKINRLMLSNKKVPMRYVKLKIWFLTAIKP